MQLIIIKTLYLVNQVFKYLTAVFDKNILKARLQYQVTGNYLEKIIILYSFFMQALTRSNTTEAADAIEKAQLFLAKEIQSKRVQISLTIIHKYVSFYREIYKFHNEYFTTNLCSQKNGEVFDCWRSIQCPTCPCWDVLG